MNVATASVSAVRAMAQINHQSAPYVPLETFDVQLAAYGSVGHFSCMTAISALASRGWGPSNLLGVEIENSKPSLSDGSPSYPITLYATGVYSGKLQPIFVGDIDELSWDFDNDELTISGRDLSGRMRDWEVVLTPKWTNMTFEQFATAIIRGVRLTPQIASASTINQSLKLMLFGLGENGIPGTTPFGFAGSGISDEVSQYSTPKNMWELLNQLARTIGYIVTTHFDGTVYVGPPGGDSQVSLTPRIFTWFATEATTNVVPIRKLQIDHGPRQYGTFVVRGFGFHGPSVQTSAATVVGLAGNTNIVALQKQPLTTGVYRSRTAASAVEAGKPNYFFYFPGQKADQVERNAVGIAFDIAKRLYIMHGEIDGDPTLVPTTPMQLSEAVAGYLQGYAARPFNIASVNHRFDAAGGEEGGFVTRIKAWYAPAGQALPVLPGETSVEVTQ